MEWAGAVRGKSSQMDREKLWHWVLNLKMDTAECQTVRGQAELLLQSKEVGKHKRNRSLPLSKRTLG